MEYKFNEIEEKWKQFWAEKDIYKVTEDSTKPKYYVLDMFPYPSGAGLHVGHPLGYVASDIYARYKRLKGFNVLHPMGFDAFGLPAEQYAIETGTHPAITTKKAIKRYREQLDKIGFSFDWSRSVKTSDPAYYKWTQWIFLKLFGSWYNRELNKAEPLSTLIQKFETSGCMAWAQYDKNDHAEFTAQQWKLFSHEQKETILMFYRLAYLSYAEVNWCAALGTVLANDEIKDGKSERGGYPVERKRMRQWFLRITEYSDRLLEGLEKLDWSESMKDMQRNWIGRSEGALIDFRVLTPSPSPKERGTYVAPNFMTGHMDVSAQNIIHAKANRQNPTQAEAILWEALRGNKLGFKFRRQHLIDKYIVDFVCLQKGLVVEADGSIYELTKEEDAIRTSVLIEKGFQVIRFTNDEILNSTKNVLSQIKKQLEKPDDRNTTLISGDEDDSFNIDKTEALSFGEGLGEEYLKIFTTRPDTIFGATFLVIAPEHDLVASLITDGQKTEIENYITYVKSRTDVERQQEKRVTGAFTGSYAINPFNGEAIPVWIAEYVLAGYGTGAIMAVPADDERDKKFAEKFGLPILDIIDKSMHPGATIEDKVGKMINSDFLNGLEVKDAIKKVLDKMEELSIGQRKVNYRQRDASYSRQRYWGEPFPIRYEIVGEPDGNFVGEGESNDIPIPLDESMLPLVLPEVTSYKSTGDGKAPLANNADWVKNGYETDIMPGYAGSSWYFLRYMDPNNTEEFASRDKIDYWQNVDLYVGGSEHAVGHLLYARLWHKFLFDLGYVGTDEPFKKLVNQGMITAIGYYFQYLSFQGPHETKPGRFLGNRKDIRENGVTHHSENGYLYVEEDNDMDSSFLRLPYAGRYLDDKNRMTRKSYRNYVDTCPMPTKDLSKVINWVQTSKEKNDSDYFTVELVSEKMSKSKYNVVNPDDVIEKYGADCFRMFEMFLGPLEQSKPWDDKGISGVYNFLRKFWRLFYSDAGEWKVTTDEPTPAEYKILHKTLKKVSEDIERLAFNTCVSSFMICVNELGSLSCHKKKVLEPLIIALAPFAPFITEELWAKLGNNGSVHLGVYPAIEAQYLTESSFDYPVSINGKVRVQVAFPLDMAQEEIKQQVLALEQVQKWTNGTEPKKFIFVKGRIINVVV
jgi:leucyl-tRNA synthetase